MRTTKPFALTALALASLAPVASAQFGGWGAAAGYPTESHMLAMVAGDFNGDGWLDLIVSTNALSARLHLLTNIGNGVFAPSVPITNGFNISFEPSRLAAADLDGDGDLDLVGVAGFGSWNNIHIAFNNGDATFAPGVLFPVEGTPVGVAVGDLDNDSDPDLVVAYFGQHLVEVFLNDGDGVFAPGPMITVQYPRYLAVGDINNDGLRDIIVVSEAESSYSVIFNSPNSNFTVAPPRVLPKYPADSVLFDADGDGDLDIAVAFGYGIVLDLNNGAGVFGSRTVLDGGLGPRDLCAADIDGDGDQDLVCRVNPSGRIIETHLNNGDGTFASRITTSSGAPGPSEGFQLLLEDFDGNTSPDVAVGVHSISPNRVYVRLNRTNNLPGSFDLLTPADGAAKLPLPGEPSWSGPNGALTWQPASGFTVSYRAQIATDPDFKNIVFESPYGAALQATTPPNLLATTTRYYWRVIAETAAGETASTSVFTFVTRLQGDTDADGDVDFTDLNNLLNNYGASSR